MIKVPSSKKQPRGIKPKQPKQFRRLKPLAHEISIHISKHHEPIEKNRKSQESISNSDTNTNEAINNNHFQSDVSRFLQPQVSPKTIEKEIKRFNRIRHKGGLFTGIKLDKTGKLKVYSKSPLERRKKHKVKSLQKAIVKHCLHPKGPSTISHKITSKNGIKTTIRREKAHEALFKRKPLKPLIMQHSEIERQKLETIDNFSVSFKMS